MSEWPEYKEITMRARAARDANRAPSGSPELREAFSLLYRNIPARDWPDGPHKAYLQYIREQREKQRTERSQQQASDQKNGSSDTQQQGITGAKTAIIENSDRPPSRSMSGINGLYGRANIPEVTRFDLRQCRTQAGITQAELGDLLGVRADTIARWEQGVFEIKHPRILAMALYHLFQFKAQSDSGGNGDETD